MKVCIIGGSKGIGGATAQAFARKGATHLAISARNANILQKTASHLRGIDGVRQVVAKDFGISDTPQVASFVKESGEAFDGLDALVWVAASRSGKDEDTGWENHFRGDVLGAKAALDSALPYLEASKQASATFVITTAAIEFFRPSAGTSYAPVKSALKTMVRYAAHTHGTHGVRINAVSPGQTLSEGNKWDQMRLNDDPIYQSMVRQTALGRFVTAEEVAQTIYFLAHATGITGANIVVDAGYTNAV